MSRSTFRSALAVAEVLAAGWLALGAPALPAEDLGLNVFGLSLHTDRSKHYNEINPGLGLHYVFARPEPEWEIFADSSVYYDSDRNWAKYAALGAQYRFAEAWKAGLAVGYAKSRSYNDGKPFVAPIPVLTYEYRRIAFNAVLLPYEDSGPKIVGAAFFMTIPFDSLIGETKP
ncbi:MAG TPA: hypothetical protein VFB20_14555 [Burkholderiales bacterium]|nr:hypothetical protein [Burkholderiales bacterium]